MDMSVAKVSFALLLTLAFSSLALGQSQSDLIAKVRQIKLLESTRDDVRRILYDLNTSEGDEYSQDYDNDEVSITVRFSDGKCSTDPDEDDDDNIMRWNVGEWTVTGIEIELNEALAVKGSGFDLSKLKKEQMYSGTTDYNIHFDKTRGLAIKTGQDGIETVIFFPPSSQSTSLCKESALAQEFYSRKSWYTKLGNQFVCVSYHADVEDLILGAAEVEATSNRTLEVSTKAVDPENDVLTYVYKVSAGRIVGNGAKVIWDLTGIKSGEYTIFVGVDDGAGVVGRTITKMVTVR